MLRYSALFALFACATTPLPVAERPTALSAEPEAVASVLDRMHQAAADADEEAYFACYSEDSIFMGTDATERWTRAEFRDFAHPFFERGEAWAFVALRREIMFSEANDYAWFDEDLETNTIGPSRGSGVLRRSPDGTWRVVHYNLALTIPNEMFAQVSRVLSGGGDATGEEDEAVPDVPNEE